MLDYVKNKRICSIVFGGTDLPTIAYKDVGMFLYKLATNYNWKSTYVYYQSIYSEDMWNDNFKSHVEMHCLGKEADYKKQIALAKNFIKEHIKDYDVIMFFNYGSTIWRLARLCKQVNPNIVVYSKLDMSNGGFSHFCSDKSFMGIRNYAEKIKSRYVDVFSVETKSYFEALSNTSVFKNRLGHIPNGVSMLDVDIEKIDAIPKENMVITIGRLGDYQKNNELLLEALELLPEELVKLWKFVFIGPATDEFIKKIEAFKLNYPNKADSIIMTGNIMDRQTVYEYCKKARIICMTSRYESTCLATLEGMFFGAYPVITNYSEFTRDTTDDGLYGSVVDLGNVEALVNTLKLVIEDKDIDKKCMMCQDYSRRMFGYDELTEKLNKLLAKYL